MTDKNLLTPAQLTITDAAREHMLRVIGGNDGVRLEIRSGKGCGGNEYDFKEVAAGKADAFDLYADLGEGKRLYVKPLEFFSKLQFVTIDFQTDEVGNRKIHISNPNEKGRCGCGQSVSF